MAPAIDDSDKRDSKLDVRASQTEKDLIREIADEDGLSLSAWVMELILPVLEERKGYIDTARRAAPRRPNYKQRAEGQQR